MRLYKYKLMLELSRKQLLKDTLYSWITSVEGRYPEIGSLKKKGIENDIFLSRDDKLNDELGLYGFNSDWYKLVKLDIVNETYYSEKNEIHITEKVFKPIMLGIPFVVNSTKNYIKNLKELDFRYPDVDYDSSDNDDRYKNVVETAEYLLDKNLNEYTSYNRELDSDLVKLSATNASSNSEMSMVYLNGGAAIKKVDSEGKTRLTIRSKELVFNVGDKIILTDRAVSIEQNRFKIYGQGMIFNQKLGTLEIKEQARLKSKK